MLRRFSNWRVRVLSSYCRHTGTVQHLDGLFTLPQTRTPIIAQHEKVSHFIETKDSDHPSSPTTTIIQDRLPTMTTRGKWTKMQDADDDSDSDCDCDCDWDDESPV